MAVDQTEVRFGDFFRDLAIAGRALSSYPHQHPAAVGGLAKAYAALSSLLAETGPIELAATRDALLWRGRRFTSPTAAQLAKLLRRRRAAELFFDPEVSREELEIFLRALALDARSAREAGSLAAELEAAGLVRLHVSDLDFSSLALVEGDEEISAPEAGAFSSRVVRRLLANGGLPADQLATWISSGKSAADLLQFLFESGGTGSATGAWGPAVFTAALRAAADDFCESPDAERAAAIAELHPRLRSEDRGRLVQELAAAVAHQASAKQSLAQLSALLSPQTAAELRQAIGKAAAREQGDAAAPAAASPRINPQQLAGLRQAFAADDVDTLRDAETPTEGLAALLELPEESKDLVLSAAATKVGRESLEALVAALPEISEEALGLVPALLERLGPTTVPHLLGVLAETDNRHLRYLLLDLLAKLGSMVVRDATALLSDSRWYVVRNILLLLRRVGDSNSVPAVRKCVDHPDLRVRLEAIRNLFAFDRDVPRELLRRMLTHSDLRQAEAAMELAGEHAIAEAVEPIVAYLCAWDPFGRRRAVRLKAIRALAAIGDPTALAGLGRFRTRYPLLPPALEERRELYRTLSHYPEESRRIWIESGLRSRDAEIRRLCILMASRPETAP